MDRRLRRLAVALAVPVGLFATAELGLRVVLPDSRSAAIADAEVQAHLGQGFQYDPDLYWYWKHLPDPTAQVDAHGFRRTTPMAQPKPPGLRRAVVLGDSQAFGGGVGAEETMSFYAEEELGGDWEVLNAGLSGYRSLNVYRLLRKRIGAVDPDVVVIDCMPKDSAREDGPLVEEAVGSSGIGELLWRSRVYYFGQLMVRAAGLAPWETLPWPLQLHTVRQELDPMKTDLRDSPYMGNLDLIARWAHDQGITPVFMRYPVTDDGETVKCMAWDGSMPVGEVVFDACGILTADGRPARELFIDHNHLTVEGNRVLGEALAETLRGL